MLAVTTIGLSTAVLGATGVASAADLPALSFSTAEGDATSGAVPEGICAIDWRVIGGEGGLDGNGDAGLPGGELQLTTVVEAGDVFTLSAGAAGASTAGEASVVTLGGDEYLVAGGGDLAGGEPATNFGFDKRVNLYAFHDSSQPGYTAGTTTSGHTGNGLVEGTGRLCAAPPAPWRSTVTASVGLGDPVTLSFYAPMLSVQGTPLIGPNGIPYQAVAGYEVQVDGGAWTPVTATSRPSDADDRLRYVTLEGLGDGETHAVRFRATSLVGPSAASEPSAVTYEHTYPAPTDVAVAAGVRSLSVSWKAPADTTGITSYRVEAWPLVEGDPSAEGLEIGECTTPATQLRCTFPVEAGFDYAVLVFAQANGLHTRNTPSDEVLSGVVPGFVPPATVPAASAPLTTTDADKTVAVGERVTVSGSGYLPGSDVEIVMYSTPQVLTTVVADADGDITATVTVPAGLANGTHSLVAAGVDEDGNPHYLVVEVTVTGGVAAVTGATPAGTSLAVTGASATDTSATGTAATKAAAASGGLAYTGFSALPFVGVGVLALAVGGGLLVTARRRRA